jgi:predicted Zn-dependent protease
MATQRQPEPAQPSDERWRLTIDLSPDLHRRIEVAAGQNDLSMPEYIERLLDQAVPQGATTGGHIRHPVTQQALERLDKFRAEIMRAYPGKVFADSAEIMRQMREERSEYLDQLCEMLW